jgi:hypothetical protein
MCGTWGVLQVLEIEAAELQRKLDAGQRDRKAAEARAAETEVRPVPRDCVRPCGFNKHP